MKSVKTLSKILGQFTDTEKANFLRSVKDASSGSEAGKSYQLATTLLNHPNLSHNEIHLSIYRNKNYYAFNKLVIRLRKRALESMLMDQSIVSAKYSRRNENNFALKKQLLQADMLQLKGIRDEVIPMYNNVIKKSRQLEMYDIVVPALYSLQRLTNVYGNKKKLNEIKLDIKNSEGIWLTLNKAQNSFTEMMNRISLVSEFTEYSNELLNLISELENNFKTTNSYLIKFFLLTLKVEYTQNVQDYNSAQKYLDQLVEVVKHTNIYTTNRYGAILLNIANNSIFLKQYDKAIEIANISKNYFANHSFTLKITDEIIFYSFFYKGDYKYCREYIKAPSAELNSIFLAAKFNYFQACVAFKESHYEKALRLLSEINEIKKDRENWNVNTRILILLCKIEIQDFESVDLHIQNLGKYIKRLAKGKSLPKRYLLIFKVLSKLINSNYDFFKVYQTKKKFFQMLHSDFLDYSWKPKTPELVRFEEWFLSKI